MATSKTRAVKTRPAAKTPAAGARKPAAARTPAPGATVARAGAKGPAGKTPAGEGSITRPKKRRVVRPIAAGETRNCYLLRWRHPGHSERHVYATPGEMILCVEAVLRRARSDVGPGAAFVEGDVRVTTIEEGEEGAVNDVKDFLEVKTTGARWKPYPEAAPELAALVVDSDDCWPWAFELKLDDRALLRRLGPHRTLEAPWLAVDEEMTATVHHPTEQLTLRQGSFAGDGVSAIRSPVWSAPGR